MAPKPTAVIVGGGIAGLAAAWWLDKADWSSVILERATEPRGGGYVVSLTGLCINTINEMGIRPELDDISYKFDENVIRDSSGRQLVRIRYEDVHPADSIALCRDDLARCLTKALPPSAQVRYGDTVDQVDEKDDKVHVTTSRGGTLEADLLIAADGIRSTLRGMLWPDEKCLEDMGYTYAAYDVDSTEDMESDCVSFDKPGRLDILYQLRDKRLAALHLWRDDEALQVGRDDRFEVLRKTTAESVEVVKRTLEKAEAAGAAPIIDTLTMVTMKKWSKGRVLLMGDAAHCVTLMSGQGAGMALASAEILGKELMKTKDVHKALANHEKKLRPVIERLQSRTRSMTSKYIPKTQLGYVIRNLVVKILPYSLLVAWHMRSQKEEIDLTKLE